MMLQEDYRLKQIFLTKGEDILNQYVEAWLFFAISDFQRYCDQELDYDSDTKAFTVDLERKNITVLAQIMVRYWLEKEVNNVLQFQLTLQDHDFKTFSASQNLDAKRALLNQKIEEVRKLLTDYSFQKNDNWLGNYWG